MHIIANSYILLMYYCVNYMLLTQNIPLGLFGTMLGKIENSVKSQLVGSSINLKSKDDEGFP